MMWPMAVGMDHSPVCPLPPKLTFDVPPDLEFYHCYTYHTHHTPHIHHHTFTPLHHTHRFHALTTTPLHTPPAPATCTGFHTACLSLHTCTPPHCTPQFLCAAPSVTASDHSFLPHSHHHHHTWVTTQAILGYPIPRWVLGAPYTTYTHYHSVVG